MEQSTNNKENKEELKYSLEFKIDPDMDMQIVKAFVNYDRERTIEWGIFKYYPELRKYIIKQENQKFIITNEQAIRELIENYYKENNEKIIAGMSINETKWREKEKKYNMLVLDLFKHKNILREKYYAFSTLWSMFPRFIDGGYFSIPAIQKTMNTNNIIAHEMLHFAFYKYIYTKHPELNNKENNMVVWNLSEIFNAVLQSTNLWVDDFGQKGQAYPEHKEVYEKLIKKYESKTSINADELIDDILREVKK